MSAPVVVLRSGGLGDFVLTWPLLRALHEAGRRVRLLAPAAHLTLLRDTGWLETARPIEGSGLHRLAHDAPASLRRLLQGADVLSFWPDREGRLEAGVLRCGAGSFRWLGSRPAAPPHISLRMLRAAGLPSGPEILDAAPLERGGHGRGVLYVHPGSGSREKNAPVEHFVRCARAWEGPVAVVLGEAERAEGGRYRAAFREAGAALRIQPSLAELRAELESEAGAFVGNDSGPTHLAAALGIPTTALFVSTDPRIWRPVGSRVQIWSHATGLGGESG